MERGHLTRRRAGAALVLLVALVGVGWCWHWLTLANRGLVPVTHDRVDDPGPFLAAALGVAGCLLVALIAAVMLILAFKPPRTP